MNIIARIKDTSTGQTRTYRESRDRTTNAMVFLWSEGNFGCDCNRAIFFHGDPDVDRGCNWPPNDNKYLVEVRDEDTAELIYSDMEDKDVECSENS